MSLGKPILPRLKLNSVFRAVFGTFQTEDTLGAVFPCPAAVICHLNIHRANSFAFAAAYALFVIDLDPQQGKITGRL